MSRFRDLGGPRIAWRVMHPNQEHGVFFFFSSLANGRLNDVQCNEYGAVNCSSSIGSTDYKKKARAGD